jgi:hypothetical protein
MLHAQPDRQVHLDARTAARARAEPQAAAEGLHIATHDGKSESAAR